MRKMDDEDVDYIVRHLRSWKARRITWEALRSMISTNHLNGNASWSRQSLEANENIKAAWDAAKRRLKSSQRNREGTPDEIDAKFSNLESKLQELNSKYEALLMRHRILMMNASKLPGGVELLADSLPDNTQSQAMPKENSRRQRGV